MLTGPACGRYQPRRRRRDGARALPATHRTAAAVVSTGIWHARDVSDPPGDAHAGSAPAAAAPAALSVMLIVPDADLAVAWYRRALGARELWNLGGVAGLEIAGAPFFLHEVNPANPAETDPGSAGVTSVRVELFVADPDAVLARALAAGALLRSPIEQHALPWGTHRQGGFSDPFGHSWSVGDRSPLRRWR